jgi:hypothetical protein
MNKNKQSKTITQPKGHQGDEYSKDKRNILDDPTPEDNDKYGSKSHKN